MYRAKRRPGGGVPGHVAVVTDPVDGGHRALGVVLIGGSEDGRFGGETQLQKIDAVTEPDQVISELRRSELEGRSRDEALDRLHERLKRVPGALGITHSCSIHSCV